MEAMTVTLYNSFRDKKKKPMEYAKKAYGFKSKVDKEKQAENERLKLMFHLRQVERQWKKGGGEVG